MRLEELKHRYELRKLPVADYEVAAATVTALDGGTATLTPWRWYRGERPGTVGTLNTHAHT